MPTSILNTYLTSINPQFAPVVIALDQAVRDACPGLAVKISYKMLMYALAGDFRHWICAIGVTKKVTNLRFLFGALLNDSRGLFRAGTSDILRTIDFTSIDEVNPEIVADYVTQAVAHLDEFKAQLEDC